MSIPKECKGKKGASLNRCKTDNVLKQIHNRDPSGKLGLSDYRIADKSTLHDLEKTGHVYSKTSSHKRHGPVTYWHLTNKGRDKISKPAGGPKSTIRDSSIARSKENVAKLSSKERIDRAAKILQDGERRGMLVTTTMSYLKSVGLTTDKIMAALDKASGGSLTGAAFGW